MRKKGLNCFESTQPIYSETTHSYKLLRKTTGWHQRKMELSRMSLTVVKLFAGAEILCRKPRLITREAIIIMQIWRSQRKGRSL